MILAALLLAAQAPPAPAPAPAADPIGFDLRCFILSSQIAASATGDMRNIFSMSAVFYFGRIDARLSEPELEARIEQENRSMRGLDRGPLVRACGQFMEARGRVLTSVGERIGARENAAQIH